MNLIDKKCAPNKEFSEGSCFTIESLKLIAKEYNKNNKNKININDNKKNIVYLKPQFISAFVSAIQTELNKIWNYSYSSHPISHKNILESYPDFSISSPLSGFGYGLPISRVYLEFFGGRIDIDSSWKKETNVSLFLKLY